MFPASPLFLLSKTRLIASENSLTTRNASRKFVLGRRGLYSDQALCKCKEPVRMKKTSDSGVGQHGKIVCICIKSKAVRLVFV